MDRLQCRGLVLVGTMRNRTLELCFGVGVVAIGTVFGATGQEICQSKCWLDVVADFVLPSSLDEYSYALQWVLVGLVYLPQL